MDFVNTKKMLRFCCFLMVIAGLSFQQVQAKAQFSWQSNLNQIQKVEPEFWWSEMTSQQLQLMLYGKNIAKYTIKSQSGQIQVKKSTSLNNSNYLFIDLILSSELKAGTYRFELIENNQVAGYLDYQFKQRDKHSKMRQGFNNSDVIYLLMPDRFANGNEANDSVESLKDKLDISRKDGRHGGDIQGIINHLDYLESMGFTQLWLNPVLENNQKQVSYHGYSTTDYYRVDERLGSNSLYLELSKKAKEKGIGIIKDVILNHIGSEHWWMSDLPSQDWVNHQGKYSPTNHRRETLHDPHAAPSDKENYVSGWFVPSMPDLNQRNPYVANYLIQNSIWWIEYADLSGIRLDTYSYSDRDFLTRYTQRIHEEFPNFTLVGEEWTYNPNILAYWQKGKKRHDDYQSELPSLMDFPLQQAVFEGLTEKESWKDGLLKIYGALANDFIYAAPENLVVFPDNHDMSRIYTQLNHDVALTKMAIGFFATVRGTPQYLYGSEILMSNPGTDDHGIIRTDFPGGWKSHRNSAFTGKGLSKDQKVMQDFMKKLLNWRKGNSVIHDGKLMHYAPQNGIYVFFRYLKNDSESADKVMVILNKNDKPTAINPAHYPEMLNVSDKAIDVMLEKNYRMNKPFRVDGKSITIMEIK